MDKQVQKNRSTELLILGTLFGAAVGAGATALLARPDNRRKTLKLWDEVKDETLDTIALIYRKTRAIWKEDQKVLQTGSRKGSKDAEVDE